MTFTLSTEYASSGGRNGKVSKMKSDCQVIYRKCSVKAELMSLNVNPKFYIRELIYKHRNKSRSHRMYMPRSSAEIRI